MQRFWAFFVVLGLSMICVGISEVQVRGKAATVPQRLTLRQLEERGPGGNAHVEISEGFLCEHDFVYASEGGDFTDVWAPAVPRDSEYAQEVRDSDRGREPKPRDFRVLVYLPHAKARVDVKRAGDRDTWRGMVVNGIDDLTSEEREFLEKSYPQTDIGKCWVLELDRRPASPGALLVYFGGGTLMLGVIALLAWLRRQREANSLAPVIARQRALREPVSQRR